MRAFDSLSFLRRVLWADAFSAGAMGAALFAFSDPLAVMLALPRELLSEAGLALLPFAVVVGYLASRPQPPRAGVWVVIALNAFWTIDSIVLLLGGWVAPNTLGYGFVLLQAAAVAVFAELEYIGLKKTNAKAPVALASTRSI